MSSFVLNGYYYFCYFKIVKISSFAKFDHWLWPLTFTLEGLADTSSHPGVPPHQFSKESVEYTRRSLWHKFPLKNLISSNFPLYHMTFNHGFHGNHIFWFYSLRSWYEWSLYQSDVSFGNDSHKVILTKFDHWPSFPIVRNTQWFHLGYLNAKFE